MNVSLRFFHDSKLWIAMVMMCYQLSSALFFASFLHHVHVILPILSIIVVSQYLAYHKLPVIVM